MCRWQDLSLFQFSHENHQSLGIISDDRAMCGLFVWVCVLSTIIEVSFSPNRIKISIALGPLISNSDTSGCNALECWEATVKLANRERARSWSSEQTIMKPSACMTAPSTAPYTQKLYSIYIYCCVGQISSYQKVVDQIMHACNQCGRTSIFIGVIMEDHNNCSCGVTIH